MNSQVKIHSLELTGFRFLPRNTAVVWSIAQIPSTHLCIRTDLLLLSNIAQVK
jgi:hypothetical protein